jgi:nucleoside-diphosphate-sugar epimerase
MGNLEIGVSLSGHRILITGASGFIGSHLCRQLREDGSTELYAISRTQHFDSIEGLHWQQGDLTDIATTRKLLMDIKPDVIFHLASLNKGTRTLDHVLPTFVGNLMTAVNLMLAASEIGCRRIVLCNSLEECNPGDFRCVPSSPYAAAKSCFHGLWAGVSGFEQARTLCNPLFLARGNAKGDERSPRGGLGLCR